jgi:hypothetical protein
MSKLDTPWELSVVENSGEIPAKKVGEELVAKTAPLLEDIKAQLKLLPSTLTYTVGWRALVWKNKETGGFEDLTEEEFSKFIAGESITYSRKTEPDSKKDEGSKGDATSNTL